MHIDWQIFAYQGKVIPPTPTKVLKATSQWWAGHLFFSTGVGGDHLPQVWQLLVKVETHPPTTA